MKYSSYLFQLTAVTAFVVILILALSTTNLAEFYLPIHLWLVGIFAVLTGLEHWLLGKAVQGKPNRFSTVFMATSALKLLAMLFITVIYLIFDKSKVIPFVVVLFVLYVIYTVFEVIALQKLVKGSS